MNTDSDRVKPRITRILKTPDKGLAEGKRIFRVAAYCRVSSKSDDQVSSYDTQVSAYTKKISDNPFWTFAGIYADWGISGTQCRKRPEFLRMIQDCEDGKIDIILCKSISRFSRNTLDAVNNIRKLKNLGIRIIFEKESLDTDCIVSEMLLTILSAFAQEESRSLSENVKWGKRKRAMSSQPPLYPPYGYRKDEDGNMIIDEAESEIVRWIFSSYEHGMPISQITATLLTNGTPSPMIDENRQGRWEDSRIWQMLVNVKYAGHILTQKRYTPDFLTGKEVRNNGVLPQNFITNHHKGIISQKQFDRVARILAMKSTSRERVQQYPYGDMLRCPDCGSILVRRKPRQTTHLFLLCEGKNACRGFAADAGMTDKAVLNAYNTLNLEEILRRAEEGDEEARNLLETKKQYPQMESVELWWLEDHVKSISFGKHFTSNDETITLEWKCGITQTVSSGVRRKEDNPRHKARLWSFGSNNKRMACNSDEAGQIKAPYGYRAIGDQKNLVIEPEEAAVVRMIFDRYEKGDSVNSILKTLMQQKIKPPCHEVTGSMVWEKTRIYYIVRNIKYTGDFNIVQKERKWYRTDDFEKTSKEVICIKDNHEAIVSHNQFERCNKIFQMRLKNPYQSYPFGDMLRCPQCGNVLKMHRLGMLNSVRHLCCEGDDGCRGFVISLKKVTDAILKAYREVRLEDLMAIAERSGCRAAEEAERLVEIKHRHESFKALDFWWLDGLAESIDFGRHETRMADLIRIGKKYRAAVDDRVLIIRWRCGLVSIVSTGLKTDTEHPSYKAVKWDEYLLSHPKEYPQLTEQARRMRSENNGSI